MKRNITKILALVICFGLIASLFAACSKTASPATENNTPATDKPGAEEPAEKDPEPQEAPAEEDKEAAEIVFYLYDIRGTGGDYGEPMEKALREYVLDAINVDVDIQMFNSGDWTSKASTSIASGETVDVISLFSATGIAKAYANNMLLDITDYLNEYAPEALALCAEYVSTYTYGGRIYGLPTLRNYAKNCYIIYRKSVLDELGITEKATSIQSWSEYEEILKAIKEGYADERGAYATRAGNAALVSDNFVAGGDKFSDYIMFDNLGDSVKSVFTDSDGNVSLYQASDGWLFETSMLADWMAKGYIWPDSTFTNELVDDGMKNDLFFTYNAAAEAGIEVTKKDVLGFDVVAVQVNTGMIKTSQPVFAGIGVPYTCEEPEAACKFINLLYTDETVMNLLAWGVEGVDYTLVDNQIMYEGSNSEHYMGSDFITGNNLLLTPMYGNGEDFYQKVADINDSAEKSSFLGFKVDTSNLSDYIAQISAVNDQYLKTFQGGGYTPELHKEYLDKLEAADVQGYLDEVQKQLDAWLEAN